MNNQTPVLDTWHKENCNDPLLHKHPDENFVVCATCGEYIQLPVTTN